MILKKLREKRKWSQEQLALMAGLSVRTIQRIERGHKASFESLKSLASVLEVNISTLEQEIDMIDKSSDEWKNLPLWVKWTFTGPDYPWMGIYKRDTYERGEKTLVITGMIFYLLAALVRIFLLAAVEKNTLLVNFDKKLVICGLFFIVSAYAISILARIGDHYSIW